MSRRRNDFGLRDTARVNLEWFAEAFADRMFWQTDSPGYSVESELARKRAAGKMVSRAGDIADRYWRSFTGGIPVALETAEDNNRTLW